MGPRDRRGKRERVEFEVNIDRVYNKKPDSEIFSLISQTGLRRTLWRSKSNRGFPHLSPYLPSFAFTYTYFLLSPLSLEFIPRRDSDVFLGCIKERETSKHRDDRFWHGPQGGESCRDCQRNDQLPFLSGINPGHLAWCSCPEIRSSP